ncbi:DUF5686 and carboxypeptidase regulatory-like domain-containing protein [Rhabdobacter roseus]|uniref:Carboxypeptidase-like regulatory domain-containing protein n=1 Tax=Rhabdobacter roseus TaxID=1655419 RepID=A0A840TIZ0_9BACT|nr:DUF5686 and carboxypeptidase regulatory-like domain-containing protein [Rhabdobacter roseus]MBB5284156.1 hypothetical protein [Rhabdobacter roseus]
MRYALYLFLSVCSIALHAQGIRGRITTTQNEPLPYAGIVVQGTSTGTLANAEGQYELNLAPGKYEVVFQYLGFKTETRAVTISGDFSDLNITLQEQALNLAQLQVGKGKEDPAYSVMRRAVAKARFHQLQIRSYSARAYTRSTALPTKIPFLLENRLKKEGVQQGKAFLNESVADISYRRPNTYNQKIVSTRNSLDNSTPTPNEYILASFYSPEVAGTITPLSPKAFAYYKFEYEGFFEDRGEIVNKIRVIPRAYGEGVFRGSIYILEDRWAIHSFDLQTTSRGLDVEVKQLFNPIQNVWLPINQQFRIKGGYLGFAGEFKYVVSMNYLKLDVDPNLREDIVINDHKKEPEKAAPSRKAELEKMIEEQKEFSTKNFRKLIKEYEKDQKKERKEQGEDVRVLRNDSISVDSLAHKRDSTYWETLRPVPLTQLEVKSYQLQDSVKVLRQEQARKDSIRQDSTRFKPLHLLTGHGYKLGTRSTLSYESPLQSLVYNTVEGYAFDLALDWTKRWGKDHRFSLRPLGRYAFGRERLSGTLRTQLATRKWLWQLEGGEYVYQFNPNNPIPPGLNSLTTLFFEQNFMKIYQKQFLRTDYTYRYLGDVLSLTGSLEYAYRSELSNLENPRPYIDWQNRAFTPNRPATLEVPNTGFPNHNALTIELTANLRPWQRYVIRNGQKRYYRSASGPTFQFNYRKGIPVGLNPVDYDFLQLGGTYNQNLGPRSELSYALNAGAFLRARSLYFPDYRHFMGNEFFFLTGNPTTQFRMLPYYQYSTAKRFAQLHVVWSSQRFLITRIPALRLLGLKETLQTHALFTPQPVGAYTEVVYGIDGLLRLFRIEGVANFRPGTQAGVGYQGLGFRIGTTLNIR